jgi:hypothetical protein
MSYDGHRANSGGEDRTTNYSFHDFFFLQSADCG